MIIFGWIMFALCVVRCVIAICDGKEPVKRLGAFTGEAIVAIYILLTLLK